MAAPRQDYCCTLCALLGLKPVRGWIRHGTARARDRLADREDVGFSRTFGPRSVDTQHGGEAMAVLFRDEQGIAADHQIPAHRRVTSHEGFAIADGEPLQRALPTPIVI